MTRTSGLAIGVALVLVSSSAGAQELVEQLRVQGGYITEQRPAPTPRLDDVWIGAIPQLTLLWGERQTAFVASYALTGALHSLAGASEISNRATFALSHAISRRTTLLLSALATQTTLQNLLIASPASGTTTGLLPGSASRLFTASIQQGLRYELTPRWNLDQSADASVFTTLPPSPPADTFFTAFGLGADYSWERDALGAEVRGTYTNVRTLLPNEPLLIQQFMSVTAGPTWRHDWSPSINSSVRAGAVYLFSPDEGTKPLVAPSGTVSIQYVAPPSTATLNYSSGYFASPLTGQATLSHRVSLNLVTPLSEHRQIYLGIGGGYLRAHLEDLRDTTFDQDFHSFFGDADITWQVAPLVQVFGRYQAIAQIGEGNAVSVNPSFIRDVFLVGVQLSSRPYFQTGGAGGDGFVQTRFPQRVDGADGPARDRGDGEGREDERRDRRDEDDEEEDRAPRRRIDDGGIVPTPGRRNDGGIVGPQPQPVPRGPSRWVHITPARPPQPADDD